MKTKTYDVIGDIHGHADELNRLLAKLGYDKRNGTHRHPEGRRVVFLGDYIDRGPKIREVLETVRGMVEAGNAHAILGNHEFNAMRFHTPGPNGKPLRGHSRNRVKQHAATLAQITSAEMQEWIAWFAGLPVTLALGDIRAVHASWHEPAAKEFQKAERLEGDLLVHYSIEGTPAYRAISRLLNGPEGKLPIGIEHTTADGIMRRDVRVKWWLDASSLNARQAIFPDCPDLPDVPLEGVPKIAYPPDAPITFFGHYAIESAHPTPVTPRLGCLDYGTGKGGYLAAYRWDGETELDPAKFVTTNTTTETNG